ncbi:MAG: hypothetical protein IRY99_19545 [Isosphaeraceae bacterium]|nr:hypothetical protein [Isosphaeraceae bacterium]
MTKTKTRTRTTTTTSMRPGAWSRTEAEWARLPIAWTDLAEWPGYRLTAFGEVWSCRSTTGARRPSWRLLRIDRSSGRPVVTFRRAGRSHRIPVAYLVLHAFGVPKQPGQVPRHRNGDPFDCRLVNLIWDRWRRVRKSRTTRKRKGKGSGGKVKSCPMP